MPSNGSSISNPGLWYISGQNNWSVDKTKNFAGGDFNNDGFSDISAIYDYGNNNMGIWVFK
jgi:hypothetical protein